MASRAGRPTAGPAYPKDVAGFLGLADALEVSVPLVEGVAHVNAQMTDLRLGDVTGDVVELRQPAEPVIDLTTGDVAVTV